MYNSGRIRASPAGPSKWFSAIWFGQCGQMDSWRMLQWSDANGPTLVDRHIRAPNLGHRCVGPDSERVLPLANPWPPASGTKAIEKNSSVPNPCLPSPLLTLGGTVICDFGCRWRQQFPSACGSYWLPGRATSTPAVAADYAIDKLFWPAAPSPGLVDSSPLRGRMQTSRVACTLSSTPPGRAANFPRTQAWPARSAVHPQRARPVARASSMYESHPSFFSSVALTWA
jgi:hypothetical protein